MRGVTVPALTQQVALVPTNQDACECLIATSRRFGAGNREIWPRVRIGIMLAAILNGWEDRSTAPLALGIRANQAVGSESTSGKSQIRGKYYDGAPCVASIVRWSHAPL